MALSQRAFDAQVKRLETMDDAHAATLAVLQLLDASEDQVRIVANAINAVDAAAFSAGSAVGSDAALEHGRKVA